MAWNIADLTEHVVDTVPDRVALIVADEPRTYGQLEERANRLAHHLAGQGVGPGDHVGIYGFNSHAFVETILAAYKLRAVPVNVNYRYVEAELRYLFDNADLVVLVHDAQFTPRIAAVRDALPLLRHLIAIDDGSGVDASAIGSVAYDDALAAASPARDFAARSDDDIYILYTGGTTGMPKGVVWRQEDVLCVLGGLVNFETGIRVQDEWEFAKAAKNAPEDAGLGIVIAPLMHGAAQWGTLGGLFRGTTSVLLEQFDAHAVWAAVEKYGIATLAITGDAMARPLIDALREREYDTSSLVAISSTAAVFSPVLKDQLFELLPNLFISEAVGSSETGFNGMRLVEKGATVSAGGLINITMGPGTIVIGEDNKPVALGETGRMARGGNVPLGYYKDPVKTAATFIEVDGERYSVPGDFARLELDGTMTLLGRGSQCINSGGEKIYPEEVESALKGHAKVFDVLVVGVADERWGQKVAAVVQPRPGEPPTLEELTEHCRTRIAGYKVPRQLHIVDEMPRQPSGKPDYTRAKVIAEQEPASEEGATA
jgi:3-oxocholest-4-en-26-oate---CoA ligase